MLPRKRPRAAFRKRNPASRTVAGQSQPGMELFSGLQDVPRLLACC